MVKLGIATGSRGPGVDGTSHSGVPTGNHHLYPYQVIRSDGETPHMPQQFVLGPSTSSLRQLDSRIETRLPADTRISPIHHQNEMPLSAPSISATASSSTGSSSVAMTSRSHLSGWSKPGRELGESVIRSQKRSRRETEDSYESHEKYAKEVKRCPLCRSPIQSGAYHHCPAAVQQDVNIYSHSGAQEKAYDCYSSSPTPSHADNVRYSVIASEEALNFSGSRNSGLRVPVPSASPLSISPGFHPQTIPVEDHSPGTSTSSVLKHTSSLPPSRHADPPRSMSHADPPRSLSPVISLSQASTSNHNSSLAERQDQSSSWSEDRNYNQANTAAGDSWETPTSLISRLTAGLTSRPSGQDDKGGRGCPSPAMSETSSISMSSSYFSYQDSTP